MLLFGLFRAHLPQMMSLIVLTPQKTILWLNRVIWAINANICRAVRPGRWNDKKRTRQDRTGQDRKKVTRLQEGYILPIYGEAPSQAMYMKICLVGDVLGVITCAKFQNEIVRGYDFTGGRIFYFPIDFWMGLTTVQSYCAACDDCVCYKHSTTAPSLSKLMYHGLLCLRAIRYDC